MLSLTLDQYLELLEWLGQQQRPDKRGAIPAGLQPILERLGIRSEELVDTVEQLTQRFRRAMGTAEQMAARAAEAGRQWFQGQRQAARVFRAAGEVKA